jgi:hypothetical protein
LKIEVKGLSGEEISVSLTPNEYSALCRRDPSYRLFIVTNVLVEPKKYVFSYSNESGNWSEEEYGKTLSFTEIMSANAKA